MWYLTEVTAGGYALFFPLHASSSSSSGGGGGSSAGALAGDGSKINLWGLDFRDDGRPLLPGCACSTCRTHSRAYVHHLLQTHEMTAQVGACMPCVYLWVC